MTDERARLKRSLEHTGEELPRAGVSRRVLEDLDRPYVLYKRPGVKNRQRPNRRAGSLGRESGRIPSSACCGG